MVRYISSEYSLLRVFAVNFSKMLFIDSHVIFIRPINGQSHMNCLICFVLSLEPRDEFFLVMVHDIFRTEHVTQL